ncbi:MAG: basic amino acid ABC transporter substrate-binding protein [Firmicutes bacterium]|nr:basic amino acid ABC transporter substrate-binding protein [Bacillota bacterium]
MRRRMRWTGLWSGWIISALLLVGCGGSTAGSNASTGVSPQTGQSAASQGTGKVLTVATNATFVPFESVDQNNQIVGFDIDIWKAIADQEKLQYKIENVDFNGIVTGVQTGRYDFGISGITITDERKQAVAFSEPYYHEGLIIAVKKGATGISKPADLAGKTVGVQLGTTGAQWTQEHLKQSQIKTFDQSTDAFLALKNGQVDAVINDEPNTAYYIQQGNPEVMMVGNLLTGEDYGIAVSKQNQQLLNQINEGLRAIRQNGTYDKIYEKWFGEKPPAS